MTVNTRGESDVRKFTGTRGEIYEQHMAPAIFAAWAADLVDSAQVRPGERVLDVPCGTGVVTRVAERVGDGGRVVGLDLNPGCLPPPEPLCRYRISSG